MRNSTIINSNANVDRFGGRDGDQLATYGSHVTMRHVLWSLGLGNSVEYVGLLPKHIAANSKSEIENQAMQPARFHTVLNPHFSLLTSLRFRCC